MNNLTSLETILIIYIVAVNVLGIVVVVMARYASIKVGEIIFFILLGFAIPIILPVDLFLLIIDKLKRRKRKQDLEQQFDDLVKENEKEWESET